MLWNCEIQGTLKQMTFVKKIKISQSPKLEPNKDRHPRDQQVLLEHVGPCQFIKINVITQINQELQVSIISLSFLLLFIIKSSYR